MEGLCKVVSYYNKRKKKKGKRNLELLVAVHDVYMLVSLLTRPTPLQKADHVIRGTLRRLLFWYQLSISSRNYGLRGSYRYYGPS